MDRAWARAPLLLDIALVGPRARSRRWRGGMGAGARVVHVGRPWRPNRRAPYGDLARPPPRPLRAGHLAHPEPLPRTTAHAPRGPRAGGPRRPWPPRPGHLSPPHPACDLERRMARSSRSRDGPRRPLPCTSCGRPGRPRSRVPWCRGVRGAERAHRSVARRVGVHGHHRGGRDGDPPATPSIADTGLRDRRSPWPPCGRTPPSLLPARALAR